jgi:hypothetical protein
MHPSGATHVPPGQSLTYNVTKRLTVSHFEQETEGHLNQMLIFSRDLTQDVVVLGTRRKKIGGSMSGLPESGQGWAIYEYAP